MNPAKPPVGNDPSKFVGFHNLYLVTDEGVLDLLDALIGVGDFAVAAKNAVPMDLGGFTCRVLGLDELIRCKKALGRRKDLEVVAELELVRDRVKPP